MLAEQTLEKLSGMRLHGMAAAVREWLEKPKDKDLAPADLVGLLVDAEWVYRENAMLKSRLKKAKLKQPACIEDIDYGHARGLSKAVMLDLAMSRWVSAAAAQRPARPNRQQFTRIIKCQLGARHFQNSRFARTRGRAKHHQQQGHRQCK